MASVASDETPPSPAASNPARPRNTLGGENALGGTPASPLGQFGWAMFDWANQPYATLITTFLFFPYFATAFVGDPIKGQSILATILSISGILIAVLSPILGAVADATGQRKRWILALSVIYVVACYGLWYAAPGAPGGIWPIATLIVLAHLSMEIATVFNNAMLPSLTSNHNMGRLSGFAWGLGYIASFVSLILVLVAFALPGHIDAPFIPDQPLLGLSHDAHEPERITGPLASVWYILFVVPLFLFTPDTKRSALSYAQATRDGLGAIAKTVSKIPKLKNVAIFLAARMLYTDGLAAIFAFGGVYAAAVFGWTAIELVIFGIILAFFAAVGAFLGGIADSKWGSKPTIAVSIIGLIVGATGAASVGDTQIFYTWPAAPIPPDGPLFSSVQEQVYLAFGILIGIASGPSAAASRTMLARLAPADQITEFFGLFAFSGKVTSFAAPAMIGIATAIFADQRAGLFIIIAFLIAGLLALLPVKEQRSPSLDDL